MTSNAGGRNDRPTLPPPFGAPRQAAPTGGPPPKSNPSIPLPAQPRSHSSTQPPPLGAPPPSQPFTAVGPPPIGAPPPSQPFAPAGPPPAMTPARSQPAIQPPPPGPPPPSGVFPLAGPPPGSAQPSRSQPVTQPPSLRSHSSTQPPPLGAPPPSGILPLAGPPPGSAQPSRSQPVTQPPSLRSHSSTQPPPLGAPPPSQPFAPATRPPPSQPFAPAGPPPGQPALGPSAATHLGIPAAPTGTGWGAGPASSELSGAAPLPGGPMTGAPLMPAPLNAPNEMSQISAPITGAPPATAAPLLAAHGGLAASLRRAFGLRIDPADVSPAEGAALAVANIHDPHYRAFLTWRRSVLLVVALSFAPLTLFHLIEALGNKSLPSSIKALQTLPAIGEGLFCALLWSQLRNWTRWQAQRRVLLLGWVGCTLVPFAVFLYPTGSDSVGYAFLAILVLGSRAVALMPGMMRAAIASKLMFPGNAAPGWLVVIGSPIGALFVFLTLVVPYQVTGSGYFVLAMIGIIGSQLLMGRAGYHLARPSTQLDAISAIGRARSGYLIALGVGILFTVVGLLRMQVDTVSLLAMLLTIEANVLVVTLLATDLTVANMENARTVSVDAHAAIAETQQRLTTFARESTPGTNVLK